MLKVRYKIILLVCMCAAFLLSKQLTPEIDLTKRLPADTFISQIPETFEGWVRVPSHTIAIDLYQKADGERTTDNPYDDTFIQSYRNANGHVIELAIAYGALQRQEVKIHRPDLCYYAQGYEVESLLPQQFALPTVSQTIAGQQMRVNSGDQQQLVSYWMRIGDLFSQSAWQTRLFLIKQGLQGKVPDGVLVRVSSIIEAGSSTDHKTLARQQQAFLSDLLNAVKQTEIEPLLLGEKLANSKTI